MVINKDELVKRYSNPEKPNILAIRYLIPSFSKYLERIKDYGIIVLDAKEN